MKPQSLSKLDLLAAAQETTTLETLDRHNKTLLRYEEQRTMLAKYQERLTASWRSGEVVRAGDAIRAAQFAAQAEAANEHLAQSIKTEQDKRTECTVALARLRKRRETLQDRLKAAKQAEVNKAEERAERDRPLFNLPTTPHNTLF